MWVYFNTVPEYHSHTIFVTSLFLVCENICCKPDLLLGQVAYLQSPASTQVLKYGRIRASREVMLLFLNSTTMINFLVYGLFLDSKGTQNLIQNP